MKYALGYLKKDAVSDCTASRAQRKYLVFCSIESSDSPKLNGTKLGVSDMKVLVCRMK